MKLLATLLILLAFFLCFIGLIGVIKGSVKFLRLTTRKMSALIFIASFIVFIIGGAMLPAVSTTTSVADHHTSTQKVEKEITTAKKVVVKEPLQKKVELKQKNDAIVSNARPLENDLEVHFIDVGQGAAQVIITPNKKVMVIDAGNNEYENVMVAYLNKLRISKIDILVGTHPDADHIDGLDALIDSFDIGKVYMPNIQSNTKTFQSVLQAIQRKKLQVSTAKAGIFLSLDPAVQINMISPVEQSDITNEMSAVIRLQYGNQSFLLTGDAGIPTEQKWIQSGVNLKSTVLLAGHHGSNHSTSEAFVKAVQPKYAVIQVGEHNNYGHPTSEVLERLAHFHANLYRTDKDGTIVFKTDGKKMIINKHVWADKPIEQQAHMKPILAPPPTKTTVEVPNKKIKNLKALAVIDHIHPSPNSEVTVTVTVKDQNNKPVNGANVHLKLQYKSTDTIYEGITNSTGTSFLSFKIGRAAAGFKVNGDITVSYNEMITTTHTAFTPQ